MITDNDIDVFFSDDFAQDATYTPQGGSASTIKVIFDNDFKTIDMATGIESAGPSVTCKALDVASVKHNDTLVISSVTYYVSGIQKDGTGITILLLSKDMV
ncbi:MAG: hypothetical protein HY096_00330 [Nitrospinae bacterium]|nr:hypothetical protein [Nitrospinota bacterium]